MDRYLLSELRTLALELRTALEPIAFDEFNADDYCGTCAIAAWCLTDLLERIGKFGKPQFVVGTYDNCEHSFVLLDGYVLDITATQFDLAPFVYKKYNNKHYHALYIGMTAICRLDDVWRGEQDPLERLSELRTIVNNVLQNHGGSGVEINS